MASRLEQHRLVGIIRELKERLAGVMELRRTIRLQLTVVGQIILFKLTVVGRVSFPARTGADGNCCCWDGY